MGNFEEHIEFAKPSAILIALLAAMVSIPFTESILLALFLGLVAYVAVFIGTSFPDIDHHSSKPHRWFKMIVAVTGAIICLGYLGPELQISTREVPWLWLLGLFATTILVVKWAPVLVRALKPVHRGITHTLSLGAVLCLSIAGGIWYVGRSFDIVHSDLLGLIVLVGVFVGIYKHLELDDEL